MPDEILERVYGQAALAKVADLAGTPPVVLSPKQLDTSLLGNTRVIFSSWGGPTLTAELLNSMPSLQLVLYGAGTPSLAGPDFWSHSIPLCTATAANAVPVVEYASSVILLSLKRFWEATASTRNGNWLKPTGMPGAYGSKVGLIGFGEIGRRLTAELSRRELDILVHDPYVPSAEIEAAGATAASLDVIFANCDVVSLHAPNVPANRGLVGYSLLSTMKAGATLVNSSRGALLVEPDLARVARERPDLWFVMDVVNPEPPVPGSELYTLPNVVLTPHLAGSEGPECRRMGQMMLDEFGRFLRGDALQHEYPRHRIGQIA